MCHNPHVIHDHSPPQLAHSPLLALQLAEGVVCHAVAVIQHRDPLQNLKSEKKDSSLRFQDRIISALQIMLHLDNIEAPARVEAPVGGVVRVQVGWEVLDKVVRILLLVVELVIPLIKSCN